MYLCNLTLLYLHLQIISNLYLSVYIPHKLNYWLNKHKFQFGITHSKFINQKVMLLLLMKCMFACHPQK